MKGIAHAGQKINSIENVFAVSDVVKGVELRRVEKVACTGAIDGDKVPQLGGSPAEGSALAVGSKGSQVGANGSERARSQPRFGGRIHHETRLVSILRFRRAGDELHALHGVRWKLRGKDFTLLIADRLAVDHKADLSVISQRVKESVGVGGGASGAVVDDAAQA